MAVEGQVYQIVKLVNCGFEIFFLYSFFEILFPVYEKRKNIRILEWGICAISIFFINSAGIPTLNLLGMPLICIVFVWLVFRIDLKLNIVYVLLCYMIFAVTEFISHMVYQTLNLDVSALDARWIFRTIVEKIFEFTVIQTIRKRKWYSPNRENYPTLRRLFILPISSMILLNGFLMMDQHPSGYFLICLGGILLVISNIINFSVVDKLLIAEKSAKEHEMLELKTRMEHSHYQRMDEMNQEYAAYLHEMRHIVKTLEKFADRGNFTDQENADSLKKISVEASSLLTKRKSFSHRMYLHDPIINTIFLEKENEAKKAGVRFHLEVSPSVSLDFVSETDKIRIFGNLLDNALEAAKLCTDGNISAKLYMGNQAMVVFHIENNFVHQNKKKGKRFLSTKNDGKRHGFGLRQAEELAYKYHGILNIGEEDGRFVVTLALSNVQKTEEKDKIRKVP